jgi:hypothetical protein
VFKHHGASWLNKFTKLITHIQDDPERPVSNLQAAQEESVDDAFTVMDPYAVQRPASQPQRSQRLFKWVLAKFTRQQNMPLLATTTRQELVSDSIPRCTPQLQCAARCNNDPVTSPACAGPVSDSAHVPSRFTPRPCYSPEVCTCSAQQGILCQCNLPCPGGARRLSGCWWYFTQAAYRAYAQAPCIVHRHMPGQAIYTSAALL